MCGISGTIFTKKINNSSRIDPQSILNKIIDIKGELNNHQIDELYRFSIAYKSDINFLNYYNSKKEREKINSIVEIIVEKNKSLINHYTTNKKLYTINELIDNRDKILDVIWFLKDELSHRYNFVNNFIEKGEKPANHYLNFLKTLNTIINSINLLEMRGRDSLGLCFQFCIDIDDNNLEWYNKNKINQNYLSVISKNKIIIYAVYKHFNRIGVLGENAKHILDQFVHDDIIISLLKSGKYENISIVAHTRWASVGQVNLKNVHPHINLNKTNKLVPTILSFVNGDIYNYLEIFRNMVSQEGVDYNLNQENDSIALSYEFSKKDSMKTKNRIKKNLSNIVGSITAVVLSDEIPGKVLIIKKRNQGMFLGKNNDRIYFASDAYGLVDDCIEIYNLDNNCFGLIDSDKMEKGIMLYDIDSTFEKKVKNSDYFKEKISSRDVSKKGFQHYLLKEIYETRDIVESTLRRYIAFDK